jgi:DNA-binding transcriptional LysR family regulator
MTMDQLRRIELLVRAADAGSFTKAAHALDLTPSAVSHSISVLEREMRATLFYRTTRQLRLTEAGSELYRRGVEILERLKEAENVVSRTQSGVAGHLRVGMPTAISDEIIMPRLSRFMDRQPDLKLEFRVAKQVQEMHATGLDILLRVGKPPDSDLIARRVAQIRFVVYAAPSYLKLHGEPRMPEDLAAHRCLVFKPNWSSRPLDKWSFERGRERRTINVPATVTTDDRGGMIASALAGGGIMRAGMFDPAKITTGQLKPLLGEWTSVGAPAVYMLYRKSARSDSKLLAFLRFIEDSFVDFDPQELTLLHV